MSDEKPTKEELAVIAEADRLADQAKLDRAITEARAAGIDVQVVGTGSGQHRVASEYSATTPEQLKII